MFSTMHEWDLEAVIAREPAGPAGPAASAAAAASRAAADTYACTWVWPANISGKALVCADGGRLDRVLQRFDRAWAEAKYLVLYAVAGQLVARNPVDLLVNCHAGKVARRHARRRFSAAADDAAAAAAGARAKPRRDSRRRSSAVAAAGLNNGTGGAGSAPPAIARRSLLAEFQEVRHRSEQFGAQLATVIRTREMLVAGRPASSGSPIRA